MGLIENLKLYAQSKDLSANQKNLFNSFMKQGFPTTKNEEWKYTSLKKIIAFDYCLNLKNSEIDSSLIKNYSLGLKNKIIFSDEKLISFPNITGLKINGFSSSDCNSDEAFALLNSALSNSGFNISVEKNTVISDPIEILFFNNTKNGFCQYRNKIFVGESSKVKFIERIQDLSNSSNLVNNYTEIFCEKNSSLEYNKIQNNTEHSKLIDCLNVFQKQDSTSEINTLIFGGGFIRNNLNFEQNGSNCESNMNGISLLNREQFADNHTFVDHKKPHCRSNEMYKGIYLDNAKGVFNGKIMVRKDSQKIDAFQSNNNLLLSKYATIDSKPQLEIYADDVKCSHGCTIGQLDEDALFYMRSRGIKEKEAKAVLTYAFASEVIESISIPELRILAQNLLIKKLDVDLDLSL